MEHFLLTNVVVRWLAYFLCTVGIAIGFGYITTLGVSEFEGARGIVAYATTIFSFAVVLLGFIYFEVFERKLLTKAAI